MKLDRLSILIFITVIFINKPLLSQETIANSFKKYEGKWELTKVLREGTYFQADSLNNCHYKEVIHIKRDSSQTNFQISDKRITGFKIGKRREKICELDPETFEYALFNNSCYTILVVTEENENKWYEIGEDIFMKYHVLIKSDQLTLRLEEKVIKSTSAFDVLIYKKI